LGGKIFRTAGGFDAAVAADAVTPAALRAVTVHKVVSAAAMSRDPVPTLLLVGLCSFVIVFFSTRVPNSGGRANKSVF
jgi:hypothetical protein